MSDFDLIISLLQTDVSFIIALIFYKEEVKSFIGAWCVFCTTWTMIFWVLWLFRHVKIVF
jgi:hypothetical protein